MIDIWYSQSAESFLRGSSQVALRTPPNDDVVWLEARKGRAGRGQGKRGD